MVKKRFVKWLGFWFFLILSFLIIAGWLVLYTAGFKVNLKAKRIEKTGMIILDSDPKDVRVFIDGKLKSTKTPYRASFLSPGLYEVKIKKEGFQIWEKRLKVSSGFVNEQKNIVLFLTNPVIEISQEKDKEAIGKKIKERQTDLAITDSEIWSGDKLISRFSQPVKNVVWYEDKEHLIFQIDHEIRIMEIDGSNNLRLIKLEKDSPTQFLTIEGGKKLLYFDGEVIKEAKIR